MRTYDHKSIEKKWQKIWDEKKVYKAEEKSVKPKYYVLDMFPYPSGSGLHVGHVVGYTATDIIARYKRMKGFNVLHPMGWDSFGLPAEQYAVRTGTHPAVTTKTNIDTYRRQLKSLGFSYDWDREIATSDPSYYKWTQWIFTKLYEKGLAYEAEVSVNFCPALGTVLANEEVDDGKSKEGGHPVIKKPLRQWMLKITAYADRLLEDLDLVDWPESIKALQRNWIGRSEGALIDFACEKIDDKITVFTACHHTIFGVSFVVLAPEHPLVDLLTTPEYKTQVERYREKVSRETDLERTEFNKEKSGLFIGSYVLNPITQAKIPVWIADYVLPSYGTGAVQAVPMHDARDFEFAEKHKLPKIQVIQPKEAHDFEKAAYEADGVLISSQTAQFSIDGLEIAEAKEKVIHYLEQIGRGERKVQYKLRDWLFSRQRYWGEPIPILHYEDGSMRALEKDELPLLPPNLTDFAPTGDGQSPIAKVSEWVNIIDPKTGKKARRETNTMPQWAGSCWYYLRFIDPENKEHAWDKEKEAYWSPVDMYVGGVEHAVLHLLYARFWHKVLYDCGLVATKEPFQTLRNQGLVVARSFRTRSNVYVDPNDVVEKDGKYFDKHNGHELSSQVEKMSKSKLNGVTPDTMIEEYGADSLRLFEMFMGPLEKEKVWNTEAVQGCYRFLSRAFSIITSAKVTETMTDEAARLINKLIAKAEEDMQKLQFNTVVAKMMEFMNDFSELESYPKPALIDFVKLLSPLAPHIAEELWEILGVKEALAYAPYPVADLQLAEDLSVTYVIQVNGKLRARLDLPKGESEEKLVDLAKNHRNVAKFLEGVTIKKAIFVPNKLVNFVVVEA
jgi:leucyl-tRNA synthetase